MITNFEGYKLNLQLFAEGGTGNATGADGGTASSETSETGANAQLQKKGGKTNPLENVQYGIPDTEAAQSTNVQETKAEQIATPTDRNAEFEKLIKGDYKDLYDARVQDIVKNRLKGTKETVEKYNALTPVLELLGQKYGVDATNVEALSKAIMDDDSYYEDEALERGITVEALKEIKAMKRENEELRKTDAERKNQENRDRMLAMWMDQAKQAQAFYPTLNIADEAKNPKFLSLLNSGIDVKTAFEVVHKDELIPAAMQYTAKTVEQKITNSIRANGNRPTENGMASQSAVITKRDPSQLSKQDLDEIERRVRNGERISFG